MSRKKIKPASDRRQADLHARSRSPFRMQPVWISIALVAISVIVYQSVRGFEFVNWDDPSYITENKNVLGGLSWPSVKWALFTATTPYWHPVTWLSHLLDMSLFGLDAGAHHVINVLIHVANTLVLFALLRRMTAADGKSAFVAALFAVHPLHVESVAWMAERKDVLSTFFLLLTVWSYVSYIRRPQWNRYLAMLGAYILALMSKPMVVTLPFVLVLLDIWPLGRLQPSSDRAAVWKRIVVEKLPLLALAIATGIATLLVQKRVGAVAGLDVLPLPLRISNALVAYVVYVGKTIWPANLVPFYPYHVFSHWIVIAASLALVAVSTVVFVYRTRYPYLLVGWLWYLITVAPVIGLMQAGEQAWADRFMYVPMIGLLIMLAWGIPQLVGRSRYLTAAAVFVVVLSTAVARAQVAHWSDSVTLWRHAVRATPDSYIAYENLGQALRERGQLEEAQASYLKALAFTPAGSPAYAAVIHNSLGLVLTRQGKPEEALVHFAEAVRLNPDFAEARSNLGNAFAAQRRFTDAIEHYQAAIRVKPDFTEALVGLGGALVSADRAGDAIGYYEDALRIDPALAEAHNGLGAALAKSGQDDRAADQYARALRLKPDLATAHFNLALLMIKRGALDTAKDHLQTALRIDPAYQPAREALQVLQRQ
jgi:tetratricopeptide (TPR) repeat protein